MATNKKTLTKGWIDFLKRNQIAELKSDQNGKLIYRKQVSIDDLERYLKNTAEFEDDAISKAIRGVLAKKSSNVPARVQGDQASLWREAEPEVQPGAENPGKPRGKKYNTDDASDIDYRDIPDKPRRIGGPPVEPQGTQEPKRLGAPQNTEDPAEPRRIGGPQVPTRKPKFKGYKLKEEISDKEPTGISEDDVEAIFAILTAPKPAPEPTPGPEVDQAALEIKRSEELNKIKRMIRDTMTDSQRKALWRVLTDA